MSIECQRWGSRRAVTTGALALVAAAIAGCDDGDRGHTSGRDRDGPEQPAIHRGRPTLGQAYIDAGPTPPDARTCLGTAVPVWQGDARVRDRGSGGFTEVSAGVAWTLTETSGCLDRYVPSGTARWDFVIGCCCTLTYQPVEHPIADGDGELVVDRGGSPATYVVRGATRWPVTGSCASPGEEPEPYAAEAGGTWVDEQGTVADGLIAGRRDGGAHLVEWSFAPTE